MNRQGKPRFAWHVHHKVLVSPLLWPIERRIAYIKAEKPKGEVALRLRLLKPVKGTLPVEVVMAGAVYDKARAAYDKAGDAYHRAWTASDKARAAYDKAGATDAKDRPACIKAMAAYDKAGDVENRAGDACNKAIADHRAEIEALHKKECPNCPWDGQTIFSKRRRPR